MLETMLAGFFTICLLFAIFVGLAWIVMQAPAVLFAIVFGIAISTILLIGSR